MGKDTDVPAATAIGEGRTSGTRNSTEEQAMLLTKSVHCPPLLMTRGSSRKEPMQTFPKLPESAIPRTSRGATPVPETRTVFGLKRSLLKMVIVPTANPTAVGLKRITTSMESPGATASGKEATLGISNEGSDEVIVQIKSVLNPELLMVRTSSTKPSTQTGPKSPLSGISVEMMGAGATAAKRRRPLMLPQPVHGSQPTSAV